MFDDPERYEHNGFYEEDTDYEGEYETDYSDYIVDDEENENVLWDDEEEAADDLHQPPPYRGCPVSGLPADDRFFAGGGSLWLGTDHHSG